MLITGPRRCGSRWRAAAGRGRALAGLGGVVRVQAVFGVPVEEIAHDYSFDPHVGLLRVWGLPLPAVAVWFLTRSASFTVVDAPAPPRSRPLEAARA